jgi:hypothetical protein
MEVQTDGSVWDQAAAHLVPASGSSDVLEPGNYENVVLDIHVAEILLPMIVRERTSMVMKKVLEKYRPWEERKRLFM